MDDEPTYEYRDPKHAGERWAALRELRPGGNRGIDYVALSMASCNSGSHETHQDIALEKLDEYNELTQVLQRSFGTTRGWLDRVATHLEHGRLEFMGRCVHWEWWIAHRAFKTSLNQCAKHASVCRSTVYRHVGEMDTEVRKHLIERGLVVGYAGRDLAHIEVEPLPRVQTWHNEEA